MSASALRWSDARSAAVWFELRHLAPQLAALIYSPVPDRQLGIVLEWADQLALPDAGPALALRRLEEVLPALAGCFIGTHTYAIQPATADRGEALELFDPDGSGRIVGRVLPLLSMLAMSLHGDYGDRLVRTVHADLVLTLDRLRQTIATR